MEGLLVKTATALTDTLAILQIPKGQMLAGSCRIVVHVPEHRGAYFRLTTSSRRSNFARKCPTDTRLIYLLGLTSEQHPCNSTRSAHLRMAAVNGAIGTDRMSSSALLFFLMLGCHRGGGKVVESRCKTSIHYLMPDKIKLQMRTQSKLSNGFL